VSAVNKTAFFSPQWTTAISFRSSRYTKKLLASQKPTNLSIGEFASVAASGAYYSGLVPHRRRKKYREPFHFCFSTLGTFSGIGKSVIFTEPTGKVWLH